MNTFLASIGKVLSIWPSVDYDEFLPQVRPTQEAWNHVGSRVQANLLKVEDAYPQLQEIKFYKRCRKNGELVTVAGETVYVTRQRK